jgi:hypothetical protein
MRRELTSQIRMVRDPGENGPDSVRPSEKVESGDAVGSDEVPVFVARAIAIGYDPAETWALYRRLIQTGADVRARRITPMGGLRRVDRMALAVSIAKAAGVGQ